MNDEHKRQAEYDWDDIERVLDEDLNETVHESIGADALPNDDFAKHFDDHMGAVYECIRLGSRGDAKLGRLIRERATPYLVKTAHKRMEFRDQVNQAVDEMLSGFMEIRK